METHEIYSLSIHELVSTNFSVKWSDDNQISLITTRGIHIFELQPNLLCGNSVIKFKRSFMYASSELPSKSFIPVIQSLINNFKREDLYLSMFEEALTPKLNDKNDLIPRIVMVDWSPKKLIKPSKCLLGTVTSAGAIDLVVKLGKNWHSICNLSDAWWNIIKNELEFDPETVIIDTLNAETYKNNLRRLQGTTICWSEIYETNSSESFCYFITAYRSCDLVIWRINYVPEIITIIKPILINRTHFDIDAKITKLLWISLEMEKFLILIGFIDGRISCIDENISKKNLADIPDNIPVSEMKELSRTNNEINIIVMKSFFLIVFTINYEGELLRQQHIQLPSFSITGFVLIDNNSGIVTTQDAKMYLIEFKEKCILTYKQIKCDIKSSGVQFLGLARAPSGATFINITSPDGVYDHLVNREPSTVQLFNLNCEKWNPWNVLNNSDGNNRQIHWDCFEAIRIHASRETYPENYLPSIPEPLKNLSIHQLRNAMWLTLITEVVKQKKVIKKIDNVVGEISEAQPLIFLHTAASYIIRLTKKKNLTDDMRLSIYFLRLYMEKFLADEDNDNSNQNNTAVEQTKKALNATKNVKLIEVERCNLCEQILTELPWNTAQCPSGHRLPRCAITLLQITCLKYRSCPFCGRIFHPSLDEEYEDVRCLYCDVPAVYDNRIIGTTDELEMKCQNLSLRPIWETQGGKLQESETFVVNEKRNKKRRTTQTDTFTLVLNKDDETITETWQEL